MRNKRYGVLVLTVFLIALIVLAACGGGGNPLIGKWKDSTGTSFVEFKGDGTFAIGDPSTGTTYVEGQYKITDASHMEISMGGTALGTVEYKVSGDTLTMTEPGGTSVETFTRMK